MTLAAGSQQLPGGPLARRHPDPVPRGRDRCHRHRWHVYIEYILSVWGVDTSPLYRPAYNVQLAADTQSQIITDADWTNFGGDQDKTASVFEQHEDRYGKVPYKMPVDGGFVKEADSTKVNPSKGKATISCSGAAIEEWGSRSSYAARER